MSLSGAFQIGRSALTASQLAIQVAGQNLANAATPGHSRQVARLTASSTVIPGQTIGAGRGVQVIEVMRQVDTALQARLEDSVSRESGALVDQRILTQVESTLNELTGTDLSSALIEFFNAFSELANNPAATETRAVVVEQGVALAQFVRGLHTDLVTIRSTVDSQLASSVNRADEILDEIASVNAAIVSSEGGVGNANELRDRRDQLVRDLSQLIDVTTVEQPNGAVDLLVGSTPVLLAGQNRGIEFRQETVGDDLRAVVFVRQTGETLDLRTGEIGALLGQREQGVNQTIDDLNALASGLIFEVNRLHSSGRALANMTDTTGSLRVPLGDQTLALNDPANTTFANLPFHAENGGFTVIVTDPNGNEVTRRIEVDLDGIDATGAPGFADDTSLEDIRAAINAIPNLTATITPSGQLRVTADAGFEVSFNDDTSGALAVVGINTYFEGRNATDVGVNGELREDPLRLVAGLTRGSNETALRIAALRETPVDSLEGLTLNDSWRKTVERVGVESASANTRVDATRLVREGLDAQRAGVSGVSVDEESLNLLAFQRQYQGAARFINVVDELLQTLISLV